VVLLRFPILLEVNKYEDTLLYITTGAKAHQLAYPCRQENSDRLISHPAAELRGRNFAPTCGLHVGKASWVNSNERRQVGLPSTVSSLEASSVFLSRLILLSRCNPLSSSPLQFLLPSEKSKVPIGLCRHHPSRVLSPPATPPPPFVSLAASQRG
jgi:hypothetical protein